MKTGIPAQSFNEIKQKCVLNIKNMSELILPPPRERGDVKILRRQDM